MNNDKTISFRKFFSYTSTCEKVLLAFGILGAILAGLCDPLLCLIVNMILNELDPYNLADDLLDELRDIFFMTMIIGGIIWIFSYVHYAFWQHLAERITFDLRKRYMLSLLNQEAAFFEQQSLESLPTVIGSQFTVVKQGIGEKFSNIIKVISNAVFGVCLTLYLNPYVALVAYSFLFYYGFAFVASLNRLKRSEVKREEANVILSATVEETLSGMKVVSAFNLEDIVCSRYNSVADEQFQAKMQDERTQSLFVAIFRCSNYLIYPYIFFITSKMLVNEVNNPRTDEILTIGEVFGILYCIKLSFFGLLSLQPNFKAYTKCVIAGSKVFEIIEREPLIRDHDKCIQSFTLNNSITFQNVNFKFPSQENKEILQNASFQFVAGKNNGVVGKSGAGKSTIVQLVNRFYEINDGKILFDDIPLSDISLEALRSSIGYVQQEPALLIGTIRDNLMFNCSNATEDDIREAVSLSNANFVFDLPDGLDTYVGSSTVQNLSGGQKQKISIARALLKQPKLLILDEATSALDVASEREILQSIEDIRKVWKDLTIITIAHRIETIRQTDRILFLEEGGKLSAVEKESDEFLEILEMIQQDANKAYHLEDENRINLHFSDDLSPLSPGSGQERKSSRGSVDFTRMKDMLRRQPSKHEELSSPHWRLTLKKTRTSQVDGERENNQKVFGFKRIMQYYKGMGYVILGVFIALMNASKVPLESILRIKIAFLYFESEDPEELLRDIQYYCYWYIGLVVMNFAAEYLHRYYFSYLGENLSNKIRKELFATIVSKPLSWFDREDRSSGVLGSLLCEKVLLVNSLTTETITIIVESILIMVAGLIVSFYFSWQFTLFIFMTIPFLLSGHLIIAKLSPSAGSVTSGSGNSKSVNKVDQYEKSNSLLSDMIMNYKTVISFGSRNIYLLIAKYHSYLEMPKNQGIKQAHKMGIAYGYSSFFGIFYFGVLFYFAAFLVSRTDQSTEDACQAASAIFFSALNAGANLSNMPSVSLGREAAKAIFEIIDEDVQKDEISEQHKITAGEISFKHVNFMYQAREKRVLKYFHMVVPAGKKIAIVGYSGSGKSTIANLLLRFYEIQDGQLLIDGIPINQYDLKYLRSQIGYVMQEPVLFNESIKQNIKYGNPEATDLMIYQAAKKAKALQFIESNQEDANQVSQISNLKEIFAKKLSELNTQYKNFEKLQQISNLESIKLCNDLLQQSNPELQLHINQNIDLLLECIERLKKSKTSTWEQLLLIFEFNSIEKPKILEYISKLQIKEKEEILEAIESYPGLFDLQTVKAFVRQLTFSEKEDTIQFKRTIKEEKKRVLEQFDVRLNQLLYLKTFVLNEGFNRKCGPKGSLLSGGQKQRIAIARALVKDPKILILDEATSALDELNQKLVQKALDKAMEGRTSVVIAHRLSTIKNCDWIYVMHQGKIVEQGTFNELSNDKASYFSMMQKGSQERHKQ